MAAGIKDESATKAEVAQDEAAEDCQVCKKGAPLWMATFSDIVTLMMAFFVLILSFSEVKKLKYAQISHSMKKAFGVQNLVKVPDIPKGISIVSLSFSPTVAEASVLDQVRQQATDTTQKDVELKTESGKNEYDIVSEKQNLEEVLAKEIASGQVTVSIVDDQLVVELKRKIIEGELDKDQRQGFVPDAMVELYAKVADAKERTSVKIKVQDQQSQQQKVEKELLQKRQQRAGLEADKLQALLSKNVAQGLAEVEQIGTKIIVRLTEKGAFPGGGAQLNPNTLPMIRALRDTINRNKGQVVVTGHTDNRQVPVGGDFPSNWDLSAVRAAAVADALISLMNVPKERFSVRGMADTASLNNNASAAERARNRRVEVVLDIAELE